MQIPRRPRLEFVMDIVDRLVCINERFNLVFFYHVDPWY
jgi:hypothetical protein